MFVAGLGCSASAEFLAATPDVVNETLRFSAYYQGPFSDRRRIGIADILWRSYPVSLPGLGTGLQETRMKVSSAGYALVERLYPFRLEYRSLARAAEGWRSIAYERFDSTEDHRRELLWLDTESGRAGRFRDREVVAGIQGFRLTTVLAQWGSAVGEYRFYKPARHPAVAGLLDEVSLLQRLRGAGLQPGESLELSVTDGKRQYLYRVRAMREESLSVAGQVRNAVKLRLRRYRLKRGSIGDFDDTVWIWLACDPWRTPLRFEYRAALGHFLIEWKAGDSG